MHLRFAFFIVILFLIQCRQPQPSMFNGNTMGTSYMVKIADRSLNAEQLAHLKKQIDDTLQQVNQQMSTYIEDSEISRFNRHQSNDGFKVSPGFTAVLKTAIQAHEASQGAFDPTVAPLVNLWGFGPGEKRPTLPSRSEIIDMKKSMGMHHLKIVNDSVIIKTDPHLHLDLNAIAKGYGVDVVSGLLQRKGYQNFLVEIGGEVVVKGRKGNAKWRIAVDKPSMDAIHGQDIQSVLTLTDMAMATSGDYRNFFMHNDTLYSHTIDPRTGRPVSNGVASATVLAEYCIKADAIATALMVMGVQKGLAWIEQTDDTEAMLITRKGETYKTHMSSGFEKYVVKRQ
ncbi:MAG: FAD:protein FMN transferase ApbE [Caldithrix sp.]|nr:FAD:protein FMN transferase ApbE [Caldithrix sp.]